MPDRRLVTTRAESPGRRPPAFPLEPVAVPFAPGHAGIEESSTGEKSLPGPNPSTGSNRGAGLVRGWMLIGGAVSKGGTAALSAPP